jgi:hypothetical protein
MQPIQVAHAAVKALCRVVGQRDAGPVGRDPRTVEDGAPVAPGGERLAVPERLLQQLTAVQ